MGYSSLESSGYKRFPCVEFSSPYIERASVPKDNNFAEIKKRFPVVTDLCSITDTPVVFTADSDNERQRTLHELFRAILNLSPRNIMEPRLPDPRAKNLGERSPAIV